MRAHPTPSPCAHGRPGRPHRAGARTTRRLGASSSPTAGASAPALFRERTSELKLNHDAPDGMCIMAGCQFQAERLVGWLTSKGWCEAPLCSEHMLEAWEETVPGHSRDTFTIRPLP